MIGDPERTVADLHDMVHPNASDTLTVRSVFVSGAAVTDEEAAELFPQGWTTVKPYLRVLPQPGR